MALLEADVALPVIKDFVAAVKEKAVGEEVIGSLSPGQALVGVVHRELTRVMGGAHEGISFNTQPPAIVLMAGLQGAGKTTTVANLAASFAETGQRVLVLDADLRSPDAHNLFDVPQGAGISDHISDPGDVSLEALVRPTSVPGVRIITAGTRLAHPESLSSRMGHLLSEAREMADVVVIDSAPLLAASDVFDILPMVDTVLLVVRSGRLTDVAAHRVADLLGRFQVPISGLVLIGTRGRRVDGYGGSYGYGYGDSKKKKRGRTTRSTSAVGNAPASAPMAATPRLTDSDAGDWPLPGQPDVSTDIEPSARRARRTSPSA